MSCQLLRGFPVQVIRMPVRLFVDETLAVVQKRVEKYQPAHQFRMPSREECGDAPTEAGADKVHRGARRGSRANVFGGGANVVADGCDRQVLLPAFAFAVTTQVESERSYAGPREAAGQALVEAALVAAHTT